MSRELLPIVFLLVSAPPGSAAADPPRDLIPTLIDALDDPDNEVRLNIAAALANLGEAAVPSLIDALEHPKLERRLGAALALGRIGPPAKPAIPALLKAMKDKDDPVRREVSYALSRIVVRNAANPAPVEPRLLIPPPDPPPGTSNSGGPQ